MNAGTRKPAGAGVGDTATARFAEDVQYYLSQTPRQLPSRYLYDALGSALFEAICRLPSYGLTRAETRLLAARGPEVFTLVSPLRHIVELGSGSGEKLALLVSAAESRPAAPGLTLHLIDVSTPALEAASRVLSEFEGVEVVAHHATYEAGLEQARRDLAGGGRALAVFLGSNIGNFDPPGASALLLQIRATLSDGDGFLIGADLVKPERDLLLAYDDPLGVTAAFNRNLLVRINRELGADFEVAHFRHRAVWNLLASRVEMHLVSTRRQRIRVPAANLDITMLEGETIWTESSYKYRPDDVVSMLEGAGFRHRAQWIDDEGRFALTLAVK
jgi:dimethylhistidine N-methyltransferase